MVVEEKQDEMSVVFLQRRCFDGPHAQERQAQEYDQAPMHQESMGGSILGSRRESLHTHAI